MVDHTTLRLTPSRAGSSMVVTVHADERHLVAIATTLARARRKCGLELNLTEAAALIASSVLSGALNGRTAEELHAAGRCVVRRVDVADGVAEHLYELRIHTTLPGSSDSCITITWPIR